MTAEINALFEEGIARCGELTDAADEAMDGIDAVGEKARRTAEAVQREGDEARQHLRGLCDRLKGAGDAIDGARDDAAGALQGLAVRATDVKAHVGALLDRVKKAADGLDEQKSRIDDSLNARMATAQGDLTDLARQAQELEEEAGRRLDEADRALAQFRGTIEAARAELAHKQETWRDALDRLEDAAHRHAGAWVTSLQSLLQRQATAMVDAANEMVDRHNDAMGVIKQEFAEQAPQELAASVEPLEQALRGLAEDALARQQAIESRVDELAAAMTSPAAVLDELRAVLAATTELG